MARAIDPYLNQIRTAVYGREVRSSIADGIEQCYDDAVEVVELADEVDNLKSALSKSARLNIVSFTSGYYSNKTVGEVANTITASNAYVCALFPVTKNDIVHVNIRGASDARAWAYLDEEYKVLKCSASGAECFNIQLPAPSSDIADRVAFLCLNNKLSNIPSGYYAYVGEYVSDQIDTLETSKANATDLLTVGSKVESLNSESNRIKSTIKGNEEIQMSSGYIRTNSEPVALTVVESGTWMHAVVDCVAGDLFTINANGGSSARAYAFIDTDGNILSFSGNSVPIKNACIKAPFGAVKLIINDNESNVSFYGDATITKEVYENDIKTAADIGRVIRTGYEQYRMGSSKIVRENNNRPMIKFFRVDRGKTYTVHFVGGDVRRVAFINGNYAAETAVTKYYQFGLDSDSYEIDVGISRNQKYLAVQYASSEDTANGADAYIVEKSLVTKDIQDKISRIITNNYDISYANATNPLYLKNYVDNIQNTHPKVLYFPDKFGNHSYWMAYTPYPNIQSAYENPCIAYSEDGLHWVNIANNPIDDVHTDAAGENYNSDTHLVYNSTTNKLECWYRWVDHVNGVEVIYRKLSSDGVTWSDREELYRASNGYIVQLLSPVAIFDSDAQKYLIWVVNYNERAVKYYESQDGTNWQFVRDIPATYEHDGVRYSTWHLDIIIDNGEYIMLSMAREYSKEIRDSISQLFICTSSDNITYSEQRLVVKAREGCWDNSLYRSTIVKTYEGNYRIYYAGYNVYTYTMGITESKTLNGFVGVT